MADFVIDETKTKRITQSKFTVYEKFNAGGQKLEAYSATQEGYVTVFFDPETGNKLKSELVSTVGETNTLFYPEINDKVKEVEETIRIFDQGWQKTIDRYDVDGQKTEGIVIDESGLKSFEVFNANRDDINKKISNRLWWIKLGDNARKLLQLDKRDGETLANDQVKKIRADLNL